VIGSAQEHPVIDAHSTRTSRWLRERRIRLALWIAVLEGIVIAVSGQFSKWSVLVIAALVLGLYVVLRDRLSWDAGRQVLWIVAASQLLALLVVLFFFLFKWIAIALIALFAVLALVYLLSDVRRT
jgi:hypothetical protein